MSSIVIENNIKSDDDDDDDENRSLEIEHVKTILSTSSLGDLSFKYTNIVAKESESSETPDFFKTAKEYSNETEKFEKIKYNVASLDNLTNGGIDLGSVTEIYGDAGSGKTQICLQLAFNCQLPKKFGGMDGKVIYISTDKLISTKRLDQINKAMKIKYKEFSYLNYLDNIYIFEFNSSISFKHFIYEDFKDKLLIRNKENIKLLIIDSIAGIYRINNDFKKRARDLCRNFRELQTLAEKYNFAIITTNQVTSQIASSKFEMLENENIPALGPTWASLVTTRLFIEKSNYILNLNNETVNLRTMRIKTSPRLSPACAQFAVSSCGIESITRDNLKELKINNDFDT